MSTVKLFFIKLWNAKLLMLNFGGTWEPLRNHVNKFLAKISQFEFLVTTEQNILVYKPFLSLNILDFSLFMI